jgi:hypothetical protein
MVTISHAESQPKKKARFSEAFWMLNGIEMFERLVTGCIALLGAFMIGMFIYVFRRRLMR